MARTDDINVRLTFIPEFSKFCFLKHCAHSILMVVEGEGAQKKTSEIY